MKKLTDKFKKKQVKSEPPARITNETVAEHRETILAGGRRFKYPLQYAKNKLVITAILIVIVVSLALAAATWWTLYQAQSTSGFIYRVTKTVPLPVGSVDGEPVAYSDYLLNYRPSEYYLSKFGEIKPDSEDGKLQLQYKKREALDLAISDAFARKEARRLDIKITDEELNKEIDAQRIAENGEQSVEAFEASAMRVLGTNRDGVRAMIRNGLLRTKVSFAIDKTAEEQIATVKSELDKNKDFKKTFDELKPKFGDSFSMGASGKISQSASFGGIRASEVAKLKVGEISPILKSFTSDGYYLVRVDSNSNRQIEFSYLHISLSEFKNRIAQLREEGKIKEYIKIVIDQPKNNEAKKGDK